MFCTLKSEVEVEHILRFAVLICSVGVVPLLFVDFWSLHLPRPDFSRATHLQRVFLSEEKTGDYHSEEGHRRFDCKYSGESWLSTEYCSGWWPN